jgi:23S rRNA (adenine1618-N6)-methyltransferase
MTTRTLYPLLIGGLAITNVVALSSRLSSRYHFARQQSTRLFVATASNSVDKEKSTKSTSSRLLHPRNSFRGSYDMDVLSKCYPPLAPHVVNCAKTNRPTIAFADHKAVLALNTALMVADYDLSPAWAALLPDEALVPPVPGRADYIHHIADLLAEGGVVPSGQQVKGLDIGVGASCVYPLLGHASYGWSFIGSDVSAQSVNVAQHMVDSNSFGDVIDIRHQPHASQILVGVMDKKEPLDFVMCNPPFYGSAAEFQRESRRKVANLAANVASRGSPISSAPDDSSREGSNNFGGSDSELWCEGGEVAFVTKILEESKEFRRSCLWFTSLVSRNYNVVEIEKELLRLKKVRNGVRKMKLIPMGPGLKSSTIVCWTFLDDAERKEWTSKRQ